MVELDRWIVEQTYGIFHGVAMWNHSCKLVELLGGLLLLLLLGLPAPGAEAATFVVTKETDDDGACTVADCALREAVQAANASPGMDTIVLPGGTYQLSLIGPVEENFNMTGDLDIADDIEILGDENSPVTIVGDGTDRVIQTFGSNVLINRITLTGGAGCCGGGILASGGNVTILNCGIHSNTATSTDGGGIMVVLSDVTLINTTIHSNTARRSGGGIARIGGSGTLTHVTILNSTISSNSANAGGAIYSQGLGGLSITNSTIANNTAILTSAILSARGPGPTLANSIIVGGCRLVDAGNSTSLGGNLQSPDDSCHMLDPTDRLNIPDMRLGPLADNGGPTPTHALLPGSPAIDAALDVNCPADDQRGFARPLDGNLDGTAACDAGAFELDPLTLPLNVPTLDLPGVLALGVLLGASALLALRRQAWLRGGTRLPVSRT